MSLEKNKIYRAEILDYTSDGESITRIHDRVVFVPGGAVGDQCDIKIIKVNKNIAFGRIEKIIVHSKHRTEPECPKASICGGCCFWHITYEEELRAKLKKVEDAVRRIGGFDLRALGICGAENIYHYRNKAQYPVGRHENGVITGFYRNRSHDIVPIERCLIQTETADKITAVVRNWMEENKIAPYHEATGNGIVRHIYVRTGFKTGQVLLCLVVKTETINKLSELCEQVRAVCPELVGLTLNINPKPGNAILGSKNITVWGQGYMEDVLCGNRFKISPMSFYQVNRAQAEKLYDCALDFAELDGTQTAVELYCGAGTITLALAKRAKSVIGVEIVPEAVDNAKENAALNDIKNIEFICADAGQAAQQLAIRGVSPDVIVVDPPRKGLDGVTIDAILKMQPDKLVYVSCDPATMARDVKIMAENGYKLEKYQIFDLFPRTKHVETVVLITRVKE